MLTFKLRSKGTLSPAIGRSCPKLLAHKDDPKLPNKRGESWVEVAMIDTLLFANPLNALACNQTFILALLKTHSKNLNVLKLLKELHIS